MRGHREVRAEHGVVRAGTDVDGPGRCGNGLGAGAHPCFSAPSSRRWGRCANPATPAMTRGAPVRMQSR